MALFKRGRIWWYEILFERQRIRQSSKSTSKTVARAAEADHRRQLEKTLAGMPMEDKSQRVRTVAAAVKQYLADYELTHRPKSVLFVKGRLRRVEEQLGSLMIHELTEDRIREYQRTRKAAGVTGRTVNAELGELSRALGATWRQLWPKVRKFEEATEVGRALSPEEEKRLLEGLDRQDSPNRSRTLAVFVRLALLTGMRSGEICSLQWGRVNFESRTLEVGEAKTAAGAGRLIPMNGQTRAILEHYASWYAERFGPIEPGWYCFPFGKPIPNDPTRPITDITGAWDALRKRAKVECRLHDLRHTCATRMAELGVPESTMLSLLGHMSRRMLERYSHIRMKAKRDAMEGITLPTGFETPKLPPTKSPTVGETANLA
jgi:integrase